MDAVEKIPIVPTIREMKVGDIVDFPKEQYGSINTSLYRLKYELGADFTIKKQPTCVKVIRIS